MIVMETEFHERILVRTMVKVAMVKEVVGVFLIW